MRLRRASFGPAARFARSRASGDASAPSRFTTPLRPCWPIHNSSGRSYRHVAITRCNVGFGIDPHVEAYCVLLKAGTLETNHEDPSIPCKHDDAGWDQTTITTS